MAAAIAGVVDARDFGEAIGARRADGRRARAEHAAAATQGGGDAAACGTGGPRALGAPSWHTAAPSAPGFAQWLAALGDAELAENARLQRRFCASFFDHAAGFSAREGWQGGGLAGRNLPHEPWREMVRAANAVEDALRGEMAHRFQRREWACNAAENNLAARLRSEPRL